MSRKWLNFENINFTPNKNMIETFVKTCIKSRDYEFDSEFAAYFIHGRAQ